MTSRTLRLAAAALPLRSVLRGDSGFQVLMVRRNPELSFGGMWAFPGGGLESNDGPYPTEVDEDRQDWTETRLLATARAAAAREVAEEVAVSCTIDSMVWFSHWVPPADLDLPKRFATWFFLASVTSGDVVVDTAENSDARWVRPQDALDEYAKGKFPVAVPTWVTLDDLRRFTSIEAAERHSRSAGPNMHHTRAIRHKDSSTLMWPGDAGYGKSEFTDDHPQNRVLMSRSGVVLNRSFG